MHGPTRLVPLDLDVVLEVDAYGGLPIVRSSEPPAHRLRERTDLVL
jgi:hypothetical protein